MEKAIRNIKLYSIRIFGDFSVGHEVFRTLFVEGAAEVRGGAASHKGEGVTEVERPQTAFLLNSDNKTQRKK